MFRKPGKTQKRVKTEGLLKSLYVKEHVEEELYVYQIRKTALIIVGNAAARRGYALSKLYDPSFSTEYRKADRNQKDGKAE